MAGCQIQADMQDRFYILTREGKTHSVQVKRQDNAYIITVDDVQYTIDAVDIIAQSLISLLIGDRSIEVGTSVQGDQYTLSIGGYQFTLQVKDELSLGAFEKSKGTTHAIKQEILSPIPGVVASIQKSLGDHVKDGDTLIVLEAMKMFNEITSHQNGILEYIAVKKGDVVESHQLLVVIAPGK